MESTLNLLRAGTVGASLMMLAGLTACSNDDDRERLLDSASDKTERATVVDDYSLGGNRYGSTNNFFHFTGDQAVLFIRIRDTIQQDIDIEATVNLFDRAVGKDAIDKWINNQYSDGIFADAPDPVGVFEIADVVELVSRNFDRTTSGVNGDEYEVYNVELSVGEQTESGAYILPAFTYQTQTFVRTRAASIP